MNHHPQNPAAQLFGKPELEPLFRELASVAQLLWDRGWAERNAGNFSVDVTGLIGSDPISGDFGGIQYPLERSFPDLAGRTLLISTTGSRMRDTARDPRAHTCFVHIPAGDPDCRIITVGDPSMSRGPTSELATHLAVQEMFVRTGSPAKVLLHAHVTELIALTQLSRYRSAEAINSLIWSIHPETVQFLPGGVGFIPFLVPGTAKIAEATIEEFIGHDVVVWEKHGCLTVAPTPEEAFDSMDIIAKAVRIWFLTHTAGMKPEGLTPEAIAEIRKNLFSR